MASPTQRERVLVALRRAGKTGARTTDFLPPTIDGGKPILRVGARIDELRRAGYRIDTNREPNGVARYVLAGEPVAPVRPVGHTSADALFELPPLSPYDPAAEWA